MGKVGEETGFFYFSGTEKEKVQKEGERFLLFILFSIAYSFKRVSVFCSFALPASIPRAPILPLRC